MWYKHLEKVGILVIGGAKDVMHEPGNLEKMESMLKNGTYLDMETNTMTHSGFMVEKMRDYVGNLKNRYNS